MLTQTEFYFKLKGSREYIQGPDIFNRVIQHISEAYTDICQIDLKFHQRIQSNLVGWSVDSNGNIDLKKISAILTFQSRNKQYKYCLQEKGEPVTERYEYNEKEIVDRCHIKTRDKSISIKNFEGYTPIEIIVSMNKSLLLKLYPENRGRWALTRLQLIVKLDDKEITNYKITLLKNMQFKLTKSAIEINGKKAGFIYFSLFKDTQLNK